MVKNYEQIVQELASFKDKVLSLSESSFDKIEHMTKNIESWFNEQTNNILQLMYENSLTIHPKIVYCISAFLCLGFSTIFHIWFPLSKSVNDVLQRLDMAGISILIFGSCYAANYYFYYCRRAYQIFWITIAFVTNFSGFLITMMPSIHKVQYAWLKGVVFSIIGVFNGLSIFNAMYFSWKGYRPDDIEFGIVYFGVVMMGVLYLVGASFYIKRIPEKYFPKKFDVWLNSHTIFHIFVLTASIEFYLVIRYLYHLRAELTCVN